MARTGPLTSATLVTATLVFGGCLGGENAASPTAYNEMFRDADQRYVNSLGGMVSETKSFEVDLGKNKLTLKAFISCGGMCDIELRNPSGQSKQSFETMGGGNVKDDAWYTTTNPAPGTWKIHIDVQGGVTYAFGFYVDP